MQHEAIGLNYIDTYHRSGVYKLPLPCGHRQRSARASSKRSAPASPTFKPGDRVTYAAAAAAAGRQLLGSAHVPAARLVKLPDGIKSEQAAAMMLKGLTVQYLFADAPTRSKAGDTVLLHAAAGGVGLIACQWAEGARRRP